MFPKREIEWWLRPSIEHRATCRQLAVRLAKLEKQLADYIRKSSG